MPKKLVSPHTKNNKTTATPMPNFHVEVANFTTDRERAFCERLKEWIIRVDFRQEYIEIVFPEATLTLDDDQFELTIRDRLLELTKADGQFKKTMAFAMEDIVSLVRRHKSKSNDYRYDGNTKGYVKA